MYLDLVLTKKKPLLVMMDLKIQYMLIQYLMLYKQKTRKNLDLEVTIKTQTRLKAKHQHIQLVKMSEQTANLILNSKVLHQQVTIVQIIKKLEELIHHGVLVLSRDILKLQTKAQVLASMILNQIQVKAGNLRYMQGQNLKIRWTLYLDLLSIT